MITGFFLFSITKKLEFACNMLVMCFINLFTCKSVGDALNANAAIMPMLIPVAEASLGDWYWQGCCSGV